MYNYDGTIDYNGQTLNNITLTMDGGNVTILAYYDLAFGTMTLNVEVKYEIKKVNDTEEISYPTTLN